MERRDWRYELRLTATEKKILLRKAHESGMPLSKFIRSSLVYSDALQIRTIDTEPLRKLCFEFTKQGTNLNQFMRFLNTYGPGAFDSNAAKKLMDEGGEMVMRIGDAMTAFEREAERGGIHILQPSDEDDGDGVTEKGENA